MITTYTLEEIPVKIHGRHTKNLNPLTLYYSASGIELNVKASELFITFLTDYTTHEQWVSIEINGAFIQRLMLSKKETTVCIFRNMSPDRIKNVRIYKDVQIMPDDEKHLFQILNVKTDGTFFEVPDKKLKIEFMGDSITSGEGLFGAKPEEDWISMFFGACDSYTKLTAKSLDADYRVISQSGWGTYSGWDNNINSALPKYYETVCGLAKQQKAVEDGSGDVNDFQSFQPDFVVINLGTNDEGAFHTPAWTSENGTSYKQKLVIDELTKEEVYEKESILRFQDAVVATLKTLRKHNKNAHLVWTYGMLGHGFVPVIKEALDKYREETKDENVFFVALPDTTDESVGARFHPGKLAHMQAANTLAAALNKILNEN